MADKPSTSDDPEPAGLFVGASTTALGLAMWTVGAAARLTSTALRRTTARAVGVALTAVDLTKLVREHVDVDAIAEDLDVNAVVDRVDTAAVATRVLDELDLPEIVRESSDVFTSEVVSGVRVRAIRADNAVTHTGGRLLRRHTELPPEGTAGRVPNQVAHCRPAGVVTRLLGALVDTGVTAALTFLLYFCAAGLRFMWWPASFAWPQPPVLVSLVATVSIAIVYLTTGWVTTGRSIGGSLLGYRVLSTDRNLLTWPRATARAALYVLFPFGLMFTAVDPTRRSLQDTLLRSTVVYDWHHDGGTRAASTA